MPSWSNEAEQRDLWVLAVPRRQEGVHRSDCRHQSNAKKIRELAPYARRIEVALELKIYAPRIVRVESSRLVISSRHAMFSTTAPQVDGDNNKTEDKYENYNKSWISFQSVMNWS